MGLGQATISILMFEIAPGHDGGGRRIVFFSFYPKPPQVGTPLRSYDLKNSCVSPDLCNIDQNIHIRSVDCALLSEL
uniref:Uncharacterized protein n=1 Tax=Knipowitschia caucasica TaxID=637954 RepID=A0AAV2KH38_KNICA